MSYSIIKSQYPGIEKLYRILGLNKNIINISLDQRTDAVVFQFVDTDYQSQKSAVAYFEIYKDGCDMGAFDEFMDRCVHGFNSLALTDSEMFAKAVEVYQSITSFMKKKVSIRGVFLEFKKNLSARIRIPQNMKKHDFINKSQGLVLLPVFLCNK